MSLTGVKLQLGMNCVLVLYFLFQSEIINLLLCASEECDLTFRLHLTKPVHVSHNGKLHYVCKSCKLGAKKTRHRHRVFFPIEQSSGNKLTGTFRLLDFFNYYYRTSDSIAHA